MFGYKKSLSDGFTKTKTEKENNIPQMHLKQFLVLHIQKIVQRKSCKVKFKEQFYVYLSVPNVFD